MVRRGHCGRAYSSMTGVLVKREKLKETHKEKDDVERQKEKVGIYKPTRDPGSDFSLTALRRNQPLPTP